MDESNPFSRYSGDLEYKVKVDALLGKALQYATDAVKDNVGRGMELQIRDIPLYTLRWRDDNMTRCVYIGVSCEDIPRLLMVAHAYYHTSSGEVKGESKLSDTLTQEMIEINPAFIRCAINNGIEDAARNFKGNGKPALFFGC